MKAAILIVDDEKNTREGLRQLLESRYEVFIAADASQATNVLESESIDLVLTDLRMAGEDGLSLIARSRTLPHPPLCVLMTAYGSVQTAVDAMKRGAADYITKPLHLDEVEMLIARLLRTRKLEEENVHLRQQVRQNFGLEKIVGRSQVMEDVFGIVRQIAPSRASVLIEGESGTGKELIAKSIHQLSPRRDAPLVTVHCAALTPQLLESELFGHEKGSFTGAVERRIGRFEAADGGTVFLDEIGEIDAATQVKILRVLGERTFERVGGTKPIQVDVRLVAATNKNLRQLVQEGKFREDLYFRLNVVTLRLPPLRERVGDVVLLAHAFLAEFNKENGKALVGFSDEALVAMRDYAWPGNVRELRAAVEHAVVLAKREEIGLRDLPPSILHPESHGISPQPLEKPLDVEANEKQLVREALSRTKGNRTEAAKLLGISRRTLHRKLHTFGLE